jgi:hypothetical protein
MSHDSCNQHDFGVFLALWNATQNQTTPKIHFRIATWLQKCWVRGETRLVLQAFRASGKSTLAGVFSAWLLHRDPDLRILVLSAESSLAEKMARNIKKVIERHPLTTVLRPPNPDQWASDSFTVKRKRVSRDPSVLARGLHANITGIRADVIICDDVEVPNTCDSVDKRENLRERLAENDFILTPGGTQIYIGTPHTYHTIYAKHPKKEIGEQDVFLKNYKYLSVPIYNTRGVPAWPERYPASEIEKMRVQTGPLKFASQMMLRPVNLTEGKLDPALLRPYTDEIRVTEAQQKTQLSIGSQKMVSASAFWDPAFGKGVGDNSVLAVIFTDTTGNFWLHHIEYIRVVAGGMEDEATLQCKLVAQIAKRLFIPVIGVETNGIGKFLPAMLRTQLADEKIACSVLERSNTQNKSLRILEQFDAIMAARRLHVHDNVYKTPFVSEMAAWRPSSKNMKDDGLDAVAGALSMEPLRIRRHYTEGKKIWSGSGGTHAAITEFDIL